MSEKKGWQFDGEQKTTFAMIMMIGGQRFQFFFQSLKPTKMAIGPSIYQRRRILVFFWKKI